MYGLLLCGISLAYKFSAEDHFAGVYMPINQIW